MPTELNRLLRERRIDVAPSSSIEFALQADRYGILPDLVIGSRGPVRSIALLSDRPPSQLEDRVVAIPSASATSVVLLKILLLEVWGVRPRFRWFDQAREDPFDQRGEPANAALFIGDVALRRDLHPHLSVRLDLGSEWWDHTGLPFAFALWQTSAPERTDALRDLHDLLLESRAFAAANLADLAERYADRFGMSGDSLASYWADLSYELDATMIDGLREFYRLAARVGEIGRVPELRWAL